MRDLEKSRVAFEALIAIRSDSDLADAAHLFLGNHWFDKNQFQRAIGEYRIVFDRGPVSLYYTEATYQLAWAYYKLAGPKAGPAVLVSFILAAITCAFSALSYAELAGTIPVSGSSYS